jgi:hypothetical protein
VAQQPNAGLGRLIAEVPRSNTIARAHTHTHTHTHTNKHAEAGTYSTHNKHKRQTSMSSVEFEPSISAMEWPQTKALDRTATGNQNIT